MVAKEGRRSYHSLRIAEGDVHVHAETLSTAALASVWITVPLSLPTEALFVVLTVDAGLAKTTVERVKAEILTATVGLTEGVGDKVFILETLTCKRFLLLRFLLSLGGCPVVQRRRRATPTEGINRTTCAVLVVARLEEIADPFAISRRAKLLVGYRSIFHPGCQSLSSPLHFKVFLDSIFVGFQRVGPRSHQDIRHDHCLVCLLFPLGLRATHPERLLEEMLDAVAEGAIRHL